MAYYDLKTNEIWAESNIDGFHDEHIEIDEVIAPLVRELNINDFSITIQETEHKAIVLALPDGVEWDDERTIRYTYNNYEFYAFLAERAKAAKALHDWATQLPPVA